MDQQIDQDLNTEIELPDDILGGEDLDPEQEAINQLLTAIGSSGNASMSVWEQETTHKGPLKFLFKCGPGDYDYDGLIEHVMNTYGGGVYRMQIRVAGKLRANHTFAIGGEKKKAAVLPEKADSSLAGISDIKTLILEMNRSNQEMIKTLLGGKEEKDPFDLLAKIMSMKEVLFGAVNTVQNIDPMEQFEKAMGLVEKIKAISGGDGESGSSIAGVLKAYLPDIIDVTKKALERPARNPIPHPNTPSNMNTLTNKGNIMNPIHDALKGHILTLTNLATANQNPETWAAKVIDLTPDDQLDNLFLFVNDPKYMQILIEMHPPVNNVQPWFMQLRDALNVELSPEDDTLDGNDTEELTLASIQPAENDVNDDSGRSGGHIIDVENNADSHEGS